MRNHSFVRFLLGYAGLLPALIICCLWTTAPLNARWGAFAGLFILTSLSNWLKESRRADAAEEALAAEREKKPLPRVFVDEPQVLLSRYQQRGMHAEKLLVPQLDKWIEVRGRFEGIANSLSGDAIHLSMTLKGHCRVALQFASESRDRLQSLRAGQEITALCQIMHGYGAGVFTLENSELTHAEPLRLTLARAS
jgi:hypothetical protein